MRFLPTSLFGRFLAVAGGAILLSMCARYVILLPLLRTTLQDVIAAQQLSLTSYVADDIDDAIRSRRLVLQAMAHDLPRALLDQPQTLAAWLARRATGADRFPEGLVVLGPREGDGVLAGFPPEPGTYQRNLALSGWARAVRDTGRFVVGTPTLDAGSGRAVVTMAAPVQDGQGRLVAMVAGSIALDRPGLLDRLEHHRIGDSGGYLLIAPGDRLIVAATDPALRLKPLPSGLADPLLERALAGWRGVGRAISPDGTETLQAVVDIPAAGWLLVGRLPSREAFEPVRKVARAFFIYGVPAGSTFLGLMILFLIRTFRPMKQAVRQMRLMAKGDAPMTRLPASGEDEIRDMVEAFNALMAKLQAGEARMAHLAHHDALTGLANRVLFLSRLEQAMSQARRQDRHLALLFIDLDGFKAVNDRLGHEAGDGLLVQVAARLAQAARPADLAARVGGDEFTLLLDGLGQPEPAAARAERLVASLSQPYRLGGAEVRIGVSIGVALFPDDADAVDPLIACADIAMYEAKRSGTNQVRLARGQPAPVTDPAPP